MGQPGQSHGKTSGFKYGLDDRQVRPRSGQAGGESILQATLKPHALRCAPVLIRCAWRGKQRSYSLFFRILRLTLVVGQGFQDRLIVLTVLIDQLQALVAIRWQSDKRMIDDRDIDGIVQHATIRIQLGENSLPKGDIRL